MLDFVRTPDLNPTNVVSSVDYFSFRAKRPIFEVIWGPVEESLQSVERIIFDGLYNRETK